MNFLKGTKYKVLKKDVIEVLEANLVHMCREELWYRLRGWSSTDSHMFNTWCLQEESCVKLDDNISLIELPYGPKYIVLEYGDPLLTDCIHKDITIIPEEHRR